MSAQGLEEQGEEGLGPPVSARGRTASCEAGAGAVRSVPDQPAERTLSRVVSCAVPVKTPILVSFPICLCVCLSFLPVNTVSDLHQ